MNHLASKSFLNSLLKAETILETLLNIHELLPHSWLITEIAKLLCSDGSPVQEACTTLLFIIVGFDSPQLNRSFVPVFLSNTPAGFSVKMLIHYGQLINSGEFQRFDYEAGNIPKYKSLTPPAINVSAITAPVLLYYSQNDLLSSVSDVERLAEQLPNVEKREINYTLFNHLDYLTATDVNALLNNDILEHLDSVVEHSTTPSSTTPSSTTGNPNNNYANSCSFSLVLFIFTVIVQYMIK